ITKPPTFLRPGLNLARAVDPHRVAVKQDSQHHLRRVSGLAATILGLIRTIDRAQVQRRHHVHQKARKMPFWKPIVERRRQKQCLVQIVAAKALSHEKHLKTDAHSSKRFSRTGESISDTHLESAITSSLPCAFSARRPV